MTMLRRIWTHVLVLTKARRNRTDFARYLVRRPQLGFGQAVYESSLLFMGKVDPDLKMLATAKAAMIINCEFCLDIGSALARHQGIGEEKLRSLVTYETSGVFTDVEKDVIAFAAGMSRSPVDLPDDLRQRLEARFSKAELAELAAEIAWENQRGRIYLALGVRDAGFADGAYCLVPEASERA